MNPLLVAFIEPLLAAFAPVVGEALIAMIHKILGLWDDPKAAAVDDLIRQLVISAAQLPLQTGAERRAWVQDNLQKTMLASEAQYAQMAAHDLNLLIEKWAAVQKAQAAPIPQ